jgi:hypothetical protein
MSALTSDATIHIRKNDSEVGEVAIVLTNENAHDELNLNVPFITTDHISVYCTGDSPKNPIVNILLARDGGEI